MTEENSLMTDSEVCKALLTSGVPRRFHKKEASVTSIHNGDKIKQWVEHNVETYQGETFVDPDDDTDSLFLYGDYSADAAYLSARSLLLMGLPTVVFDVPYLFAVDSLYVGRLAERLAESLVIVLLGYNDDGMDILGPSDKLYAVQWWIHRALDNGKLFVFQGCMRPALDDVWGKTLNVKVSRGSTIIECRSKND